MRFLLLFLILGISVFGQNSVELCQNGEANGYACSNIHLMSFVDANTLNGNAFAELNDIWGWTDTNSGREFALVGMTTGMACVEITDPVNPIVLGKLPTHTTNSLWRDMKVYQNHAFIGSEAANHGMQVFDLTELLIADPNSYTTFTETAHYAGFNDSHNIVINENSGFAYGVGANFSGGLHAVNIQTPTSPVIAGGFSDDGYTHDAQVVNYIGPDPDYLGSEIAFCFNADALTIVDVTDKTDMSQISTTTYVGEGYTHQGWVTEDHKYLLMDDETDELIFGVNTTTFIWNIQDLDNPILIGTYVADQTAIDHNLYILDELAFLANYRAGLRILDISDIENANLNEIGFFDTYVANDNPNFNGLWSNYPYFSSQNIVLSDIEQGLFVVRPVFVEINELELACPNLDHKYELLVSFGLNGPIDISISNLPGNVSAVLTGNNISLNETVQLTLSNIESLTGGQYTFDITFSDGLVDHTETISFSALSSGECDDGDPCTTNDVEFLLADGSVCVPCAGILNSSSCIEVCTSQVSCDDGNPCTTNDLETIAADGTVCIPCSGIIDESSCNTECTTSLPCDDGNPCTVNDIEIYAADGSICIPCSGTIDESSCNTECTTSLPCDDGNPCTINDIEIYAADGSICIPCSGTIDESSCDSECTMSLPCNDGNPCTINDIEVLAANGTTCIPCTGIIDPTSCDPTCTTDVVCDDGNPFTENDIETLALDGSLCIPCSGTPIIDSDGDGIPNESDNCPTIFNPSQNLFTFYFDGDGDGFGDPLISTQACEASSVFVANTDDCDDTNADVNPDAPEDCSNGIDDNCDSVIDSICTACISGNFTDTPVGLYVVQNATKTRLKWEHYSDATRGCLIATQQLDEFGNNVPGGLITFAVTWPPHVDPDPEGDNKSGWYTADQEFVKFNQFTYPSGNTASWVPGADYKWRVKCACLIDESIPNPEKVQVANRHASPWSEWNFFTNLTIAGPSSPNLSEDNLHPSELNISISPNPTNGLSRLEIQSELNEILEITVYDIMGNAINTSKESLVKGTNNFKIDLSNKETGFYLLQLATPTYITTEQILKN